MERESGLIGSCLALRLWNELRLGIPRASLGDVILSTAQRGNRDLGATHLTQGHTAMQGGAGLWTWVSPVPIPVASRVPWREQRTQCQVSHLSSLGPGFPVCKMGGLGLKDPQAPSQPALEPVCSLLYAALAWLRPQILPIWCCILVALVSVSPWQAGHSSRTAGRSRLPQQTKRGRDGQKKTSTCARQNILPHPGDESFSGPKVSCFNSRSCGIQFHLEPQSTGPEC